ncbi:hypothetical protein C8P68_104305 [Mucilaginibacter yixingensis]|uniref:LPS-assembly protein LptD central domain-containing protein n=1 Tax=Mucilaginibacter yixingensis TaxID=1295612 RepID=A0A2T5J9S2_9SPHI|nr:putative LPS assembly protein LptD [Mucilaginibacter yixingensis]PTQ96815.1 hypothetical protein C8P68_104305 [Mucilaginibacter yixingensis]
MKFLRLFFLLVVILALNELASANKSGKSQPVWLKDTIIKLDPVKDRKLLRGNKSSIDTIRKDTTKRDTTKKDTVAKNPGELTEITTAKADDSTVYDKEHQVGYLYGNARVTYGDFELDADYIRVDQKTHLVFASGRIDPKTHRYKGRPISKMGKDDKPMTADSLYFDYKTKKAHVYNGSTEQDGNFVSGGQIKKLNDSEFAYHNVLYSTCDKPYPYTDFGIVITKGIAEKKRIISGPAYMEIEGVPLPFAIPFGFFPKPDTRTSGFILPTFGEDATLGFYLRNFGYYFGINDYMDFTTQETLYSKGSFESTNTARYIKKYKYQGGLTFSYGQHYYGLEGDPPQRDFNIQWQHSQDANAHPGTTFSASVNAGTSSYYSNNPGATNYNPQAIVQNNLHSSIAYAKSWEGTPFNFNASMTHSQDLARKTITLELPTFSFNMATINPFDSKDRVGPQKWYQRITVGYSLQGKNAVTAVPESELFSKETLTKRLQNGFQHQIPVGFNQTLLKFFQFNVSANYNERWYLQTYRKRYARGSLSGIDSMIVDTVPGFRRVGDYSMSAGFSTKIYGIMQFKGKLKAIRDVITPNISFSYRPDYSSLSYAYNQVAVSNATVPFQASYNRYSIFDGTPYGGPSGGRQAGLSFSVDNTIEAKVRPSAKDTSTQDKKIPILQGLSASTFYNFAADSFRLENISLSGHTALFNQKINVSFSGILDPYVTKVYDTVANNQVYRVARRFDHYTFQDGRLPFLTNFNLTMGGSLNSASFHPASTNTAAAVPGTSAQTMTVQQADRLALLNSDPSAYIDFNIPWNVSMSYSFNYSNSHILTTTTNTLQLNGDFSLTPKWKIQYSTNYDIKANQFTMTSFNIYRDLHCWDLSFQWVPFGYYRSYNVTLKVKATILQDLKLSKRKDYYNNF